MQSERAIMNETQCQQLDPAFELVWLEKKNGSFTITLNNEDGSESDLGSLFSSDESSNGDVESTHGMASLLCFAPAPKSPRTPLAPVSPAPSNNLNDASNTKVPRKRLTIGSGPRNIRRVTSGIENVANLPAQLNLVSNKNTVPSSPCVLDKTSSNFSAVGACISQSSSTARDSLFQATKAKRKALFSRKPPERVIQAEERVIKLNLPEDHGPIRREMPVGQSISSNSSEATTDHASNVSFAKLASTIITSQGAKKAVEPMDRIAAVLESKGVGRGTLSVRELRSSSNLRLFIDDYSEANFWSLLDSLYCNKCLNKLVLFRNGQSGTSRVRTNQEMDCFFRILNRMTSTLSELHLWNFGPDDQATLSRGLAYSVSLEYVQIHFEAGALSSSLCKSLATLPNLVSLELEVSTSFPIAELLESTSLGVLSIICSNSSSFEFDANEILRFAKKLEGNTSLSVLSIEPCISIDVSLPALLRSLKISNNTLETLQFSCTAAGTKEGDTAMEGVLDTLQTNSKLRVLWNHRYESWSVSAKMRQKVLQVLKQNKTIQQFYIFPEAADYWFQKNNVLQTNISCP